MIELSRCDGRLTGVRRRDEPEASLDLDVQQASWVLEHLPALGIDLDQVTQQLEDEGVEKFNRSFDKLMDALIRKSAETDTKTDTS